MSVIITRWYEGSAAVERGGRFYMLCVWRKNGQRFGMTASSVAGMATGITKFTAILPGTTV